MNHKIVVLDGYTLSPGDISWSELRSLVPTIEIYDRTRPDEVDARCAGASIVLTNKVSLNASTIKHLRDLKFISVMATGYNNVDAIAARQQGIVVSNVPAYATSSVAQLIFAFILHWTNGVAHHSNRIREGAWTSSPDFCFWDFPLHELAGKTLGILGLGRIGREVGRMAHAFGMKIAAAVRSPKHTKYPVEYLSIENLFKTSDFLCVLCPLTPDTVGLVNKKNLQIMKPTSYLINTARGGIVVEQDLADALNEDRIAGAALDVLSTEPPPSSNPLLTARNVVITPHHAWATVEARKRLMDATVENVRAFLSGSPQNVVN